MDSVTHVVLGAACGELVAGRRLGNRAMLWGAIGCSIPDLDVLAHLFTDELTAIAFHRGFLHSFFFLALAPWGLARLVQLFYHHNIHAWRGYKRGVLVFILLFYLLAMAGINAVPYVLGYGLRWWLVLPALLLGYWLGRRLWRDYWLHDLGPVQASYGTWVALFAVTLYAHTLLDCCTNFGTQVWQPFSDYRVQWNLIGVADIVYTLPFLLIVSFIRFIPRDRPARWKFAAAGLLWTALYLGYCFWHKQQVETIFRESLAARGLSYNRFLTGPTLLQNVVWYGLAESDTAYYWGQYGFNDRERAFTKLVTLPKHHELLEHIRPDDRAYHFVRWFSSGYYNVLPYNGDSLQVNDLRFGLTSDSLHDNNYVYSFSLFPKSDGSWDIHALSRNREKMLKEENAFGALWRRVLGR